MYVVPLIKDPKLPLGQRLLLTFPMNLHVTKMHAIELQRPTPVMLGTGSSHISCKTQDSKLSI